MSKTILVSNRLPFSVTLDQGQVEFAPSVGGLATGLKSVHQDSSSLWVGWAGLTQEELSPELEQEIKERALQQRCLTVVLTEHDVSQFYLGFSNNALWPLFHYFLEYTRYDPLQWDAYMEVNYKYAEVILENADPGDIVWVHDYQLMALPQILRQRMPSLTIGFFLHIPFPAFEIYRTFPWREELLQGLLGASLIGFHTYDYVQHFLNSVRRILGYTVRFNEITVDQSIIRVDSFPMGIDYSFFHNAAIEQKSRSEEHESEVQRKLREHLIQYPDRKLILSIDRMDYTKGIPERIRAFEYFLEQYPQFKEKVRLLMLVVPSRSDVPQYRKLKKETDELVGRVNGRFSTIDWTPIWYFYRAMPFQDLIALYASCPIALISPLRDGMNLVAKEYVATRVEADGVLILSEMAGAASEMHEALLINPTNINQFADTLKAALEMPLNEQQQRFGTLQKRLARYPTERWATDFLKSLQQASYTFDAASPCQRLTEEIYPVLLSQFKNASSRLLLLDYDGTLVNFTQNPADAFPDRSLLGLLNSFDKHTECVIISGRSKESLESWFGNQSYTLVTDHGVWLRREGIWEQIEYLKTDWKEALRPIMENFVDRTPGAFIEEKSYSLAWHYRRADADLSEIRKRELQALLMGFVADNGLSVLDGDKVVEVKSNLVNKGRAATRVLANRSFDFVLAIGDDKTDEYMFEELPGWAVTVKVGTSETKARYFVRNPSEVRQFLLALAESPVARKENA
jgi:trehalose 6-phosphate synthase/phosphatase